jgi:pimeloyl-ACP methyl ester carboxylesterase
MVPAAGSLESTSGCRIDTLLYRPERPRTDALVVLGHGFLRDQGRMAGLAEALARAGIRTVTLDFCNSRFWDGRHVQNGRDMRRVAEHLGAHRVVYVGFSAGGLSALVAAWDDPRTAGVLTLDLVDDGRLGEGLARTLRVPLLGLQGDPAPCNAQANGLAVFAASTKAQILRVPGATHCDFESPTDWLCESVCGRSDSAADRRREVIERSVAIVTRLLGTESQATAATPAAQRNDELASARGPQT